MTDETTITKGGKTSASSRRPARLLDDPDLLSARLAAIPLTAGVYQFLDESGTVIYVGKAGVLRNRVRSYFSGIDNHHPRTRSLVETAVEFRVIACANDEEALLLENVLIKRYRPHFNVALRDDKTYLYLRIPRPRATGPALERFPRPHFVRRVAKDDATYFGPYSSSRALREAIGVLRTAVPFRGCSDDVFARGKVCLDFHIKRCCGPCEGRVTEVEYANLMAQVAAFLNGDTAPIVEELSASMERASQRLDFEYAARVRDRLSAIAAIRERQTVVKGRHRDEDVLGIASDGKVAVGCVLVVRQGRVIGAETYDLVGSDDISISMWLDGFFDQYYGNAQQLPHMVVVPTELSDMRGSSSALSLRARRDVEIRVAQRGILRDLSEHAAATAASALSQRKLKDDFDVERAQRGLDELHQALDLSHTPHRIECYDISNTMGTHSVASMVVFLDGRPAKQHYRQFSIRSVEGPNDFASMAEALSRRFGRRSASGGAKPDRSFSQMPDLLLIDGGKGQVSAVVEALDQMEVVVPIVGLAKRFEELYPARSTRPVILPRDSEGLFLVQRVRDEAHRFAITQHRSQRGKAAVGSVLDAVPGVGPAKKRALIRALGSVAGIKAASVEEIAAVPGFSLASAKRLKDLL